MLQVPTACCGIQVEEDSGSREQSVLGRDCIRDHWVGLQRWLVPSGVLFDEPCGSGRQETKDRYTMQSEVRYLSSGYGREGRRAERERGREGEREHFSTCQSSP